MAHLLFLTALALIPLCCSAAPCWGADPVPRKNYPKTKFLSKFPTTATVVVSAGGSVTNAQMQCNTQVGRKGYCLIELRGVPSDIPIRITRSRTKLTSIAGVVITSSGKKTFVELNKKKLKHVAVSNLELMGHAASEVYGIVVSGNGLNGIVIEDCKIHDFDGRQNAHGIAVYGEGTKPIRNVLIRRNEVYDMRTGTSESIVVNGYVTRWAISENNVHDVNNIAIDAIGGEGTFKPIGPTGEASPNPSDAASFGFIEDNTVSRMSTKTNPGYNNKESWAAAIYVDGANNIMIRRNTVEDTPWAFDVGAENCVVTEHITVTDNSASGSFYGDFLSGGYTKVGYMDDSNIKCDPRTTKDNGEGHGNVRHLLVENNMFSSTGNREDKILTQFRTTCALILETGATAENEDGDGSATGDDNAVCTSCSRCTC